MSTPSSSTRAGETIVVGSRPLGQRRVNGAVLKTALFATAVVGLAAAGVSTVVLRSDILPSVSMDRGSLDQSKQALLTGVGALVIGKVQHLQGPSGQTHQLVLRAINPQGSKADPMATYVVGISKEDYDRTCTQPTTVNHGPEKIVSSCQVPTEVAKAFRTTGRGAEKALVEQVPFVKLRFAQDATGAWVPEAVVDTPTALRAEPQVSLRQWRVQRNVAANLGEPAAIRLASTSPKP